MALSIWQCEAVAFLCSKKTFTENRQLSQINWQFHETNHLCRIWCEIEKQITCRAFRRFLAELEALVFPWTCSDMSVYNKKKLSAWVKSWSGFSGAHNMSQRFFTFLQTYTNWVNLWNVWQFVQICKPGAGPHVRRLTWNGHLLKAAVKALRSMNIQSQEKYIWILLQHWN